MFDRSLQADCPGMLEQEQTSCRLTEITCIGPIGHPAIDLCDLNETSRTFDDRSSCLKLVLVAEEDPETRRGSKFYPISLSLSIR
jgi:hypothetical protein